MAPKKSSLVSLFEEHSSLDLNIRSGVILLTLFSILLFGSVFESSYHERLVELYGFPWWRILIVCTVVIGSMWCPRVGFVLALAAFFYLNDMYILTQPFVGTK
jgi:hypothetical protein